jgi:hypothetical protein
MTLFFEHLNAHTGITPPDFSESAGVCMKKEALINQIIQHDKTVFEALAERASLWRFLHRVQCTQLNTLYQQAPQTDAENNARLKLIRETLWMATLLEELHLRLNEKRAAEPFRVEQLKLRKLLHEPETNVKSPHEANDISDHLELFHRWFTYNFDSTRLFAGHVRRICAGVINAPLVFGYDYVWANAFAEAMGPILSLASLWVYLPRTLSNIFIIAERFYDNNHEIGLEHRKTAHCELNDRLFNLVNDSPSVIAAVLATFILSGPSLAFVVYITVLVKAAEVIFSSTRAYFESTRFDAQRDEFNALKTQTPADADTNAYLDHLDRCITNEKGRFIATAIMHGLLLFCLAAFTPPLLALSPWVPIVAALSAMLVLCLRFADFRDFWIPERPNDSLELETLSKDRFFQPPQKELGETEGTCLTSSGAPVSI